MMHFQTYPSILGSVWFEVNAGIKFVVALSSRTAAKSHEVDCFLPASRAISYPVHQREILRIRYQHFHNLA